MAHSPNPSTYSSFVKDWNGRQGWAQENGIPYSDYTAAVKYDYNRMITTGYKMSDVEAFDSMAALKQGQNPFQTPSDIKPSLGQLGANPIKDIGDLWGVATSNVQNLVTGIEHTPQAIWGDVQQAKHGNWGGFAQFIPGEVDVTKSFSPAGRSYLAQNPISDVLDLTGYGKIADVAEAGLRQIGADGAADLLQKVPDHPISNIIKKNFTAAAKATETGARVQKFGTNLLESVGLLKYQKDILRGVAMINKKLPEIPTLENFTSLADINWGDIPQGERLTDTVGNILDSFGLKTDPAIAFEKYNDLRDLITTSSYKDQVIGSPKDILSSDLIPKDVRAAYKVMLGLTNSMQMANRLIKGDLKYVVNPITDEGGYVRVDSPYLAFAKRWTRVMDKRNATQSSFGQAVSDIYNSLHQVKTADSGVPKALKVATDTESVNIPTAFRRVQDYYLTKSDNLFGIPKADRLTKAAKLSFARFNRTVTRLFGSSGTVNDIVNDLGSLKGIAQADDLLKSLESFRKSMVGLNVIHDDVYNWIQDQIPKIKQAVTTVRNNQLDLPKLEEASKVAERRAANITKLLTYRWNRYVEGPRFARLVDETQAKLVKKAINDLKGSGNIVERLTKDGTAITITPEMMDQALSDIEHHYASDPDSALHSVITDNDWADIRKQSFMMISDMKAEGIDPLFVHGMTPAAVAAMDRPWVTNVTKFVTRSVQKDTMGAFGTTIYDPMLAIVAEAREFYLEKYIEYLHDNFIAPHTYTISDMLSEAKSFAFKKTPQILKDGSTDYTRMIDQFARSHGYVRYDPDVLFSGRQLTWANSLRNAPMWIKRYDERLISGAIKSYTEELNKAYSKAMQVYRLSVLTSPRFGAHVTIAGSVMTLARMERPVFDTVRYLGDAIKMGKDPVHNLPSFVSFGVSEQDLSGALIKQQTGIWDILSSKKVTSVIEDSLRNEPQSVWNMLAGRKVGQLLQESMLKRVGNKALASVLMYQKVMHTVSNIQRSLTYLSKMAHISPEELTPDVIAAAKRWDITPEQYLAGTAVNNVLADVMSYTPIERGLIIRYIIPFYGWSKAVVKYMAKYPADFPLRMNFAQVVSEQAIGDGGNLPEYLYRMLFLGQPNAAGTVSVLDVRQWNPFRDAANLMSFSGLTSILNPVLDAFVSTVWGANTTTGSLDMYPTLTYDSFYGSDTATSGQNFFQALAQQVSPQADLLIELSQSTSALREAAKSNPGELGYLIGDKLGMPWIPFPINLKNISIKKTLDEYGMANTAVNSALVENSMSPLSGYSGYLPLQGYESNKAYIGNVINEALALNKESGMDLPAEDLLSLMSPSPYYPQYLLAGGQ